MKERSSLLNQQYQDFRQVSDSGSQKTNLESSRGMGDSDAQRKERVPLIDRGSQSGKRSLNQASSSHSRDVPKAGRESQRLENNQLSSRSNT